MNTKNIVSSLNLTEGEVLTLEKAADRMEFEALPVMAFEVNSADCECKGDNCGCKTGGNCSVKVF